MQTNDTSLSFFDTSLCLFSVHTHTHTGEQISAVWVACVCVTNKGRVLKCEQCS